MKKILAACLFFVVAAPVATAQVMRAGKDGAVNISVRDNTYDPFDLYFGREDFSTTLTATATTGATSLSVASIAGVVVGEGVLVKNDYHTSQFLVMTATGSTIGLNMPVDRTYAAGSIVRGGKWNANVDGSVTPQIYRLRPPVLASYHVNRLIFGLTSSTPMDDATFGGIARLAKGFYCQAIQNNVKTTLFVVSDNGGFKERAFDADYSSKAPAGSYGLTVKKTFNGEDHSGVTINLDGATNDEIQCVVQDNNTGNSKLAITAQGHETTREP